MIESTKNPLPDFDVLDFEVHAVYGAHLEIPADEKGQKQWADWFDTHKRSSDPSHPIREGWTPIYRDHCSTVTVGINTPPWCSEIEVRHPEFFRRGEPDNIVRFPITMRVSRSLTVRKDGVAAITIRLEATRREVDKQVTPYTLADILAPLLLAPRIIEGIKLHPKGREVRAPEELATTPSEIYRTTANADPDGPQALLDGLATLDKSSLFKLFLGALKEVVSEIPLNWCEYRAASSPESHVKKQAGKSQRPPEILPWVGDQQIPYFVVLATLPKHIYDEAFLEDGAKFQKEKLKARSPYTRPLAAILQRWLSPHNAAYVSVDFLESLKLLRDGVFINKYMNSLTFVTYSSTGTLCLRPEPMNGHDHGELDPQEATYGSILRCVELSRLRWHHALRLNGLLDDLTERVIRHRGTEGFDNFVAELLRIRAESALHLLDPLTYQWDAAVGADIAKFLQGGVIEQIENECIEKLNMVKQLIHETLDVFRIREMRQALAVTRPMKR